MALRPRALRAAIRATGLAAVGFVVGCGPAKGPQPWIDARAAVVQCTTAGRHPQAPVLLELPVPQPPVGLYARGLDPMALDDLGYQRDGVACAILSAPRDEVIDGLEGSVRTLLRVQTAATEDAIGRAARCTCDAARAIGMLPLIPRCSNMPTLASCDPEEHREAIEQSLRPLVEAIETSSLPLVHWRLVGPTDRPGWFLANEARLLPRYDGGSTLHSRDRAVTSRGSHELVRRLLDEEGVVAVATQEGGQALLVVRELGRELVYDHFRHPIVDKRQLGLLALWDNAHVEDYIAALARPTETRRLELEPGDGNLVEIDRERLAAIDAIVDAAAPLGGLEPREALNTASPFVDRATLQAPFGHDGKKLVIKLRMSSAGSSWAQALSQDYLSPSLAEIESTSESSSPVLTDNDELPYVLRGTAAEAYVFHGLPEVPRTFRAVEMNYPGTVRGTASRWRFDLPRSDFEDLFGPELSFGGLRETMGTTNYVVRGQFDNPRQVLELESGPR